MNELVLYFSLKYDGDFLKIYEALANQEPVDKELKKYLMNEFMKTHCKYITIFDKEYPNILRKTNQPPFVIYYYGNLELLKKKTLAVIGSTRFDEYGKDITIDCVDELVENDVTIINGMACGIQTIALERAIKKGGKTIVVLGCGIEECYPKINNNLYESIKDNQLIISEYPFHTKVDNRKLIYRNRIIAAISHGVIVTQIKEKSSSMTTVGYALQEGKEVYCIPGQFRSEYNGTNILINNGANIYYGISSLELF